jgi:hypothetical protein
VNGQPARTAPQPSETLTSQKDGTAHGAELPTAQKSIVVSEVLNLLADAIWADFIATTASTVNSRGGTNHDA